MTSFVLTDVTEILKLVYEKMWNNISEWTSVIYFKWTSFYTEAFDVVILMQQCVWEFDTTFCKITLKISKLRYFAQKLYSFKPT